MTFSFRQEGVRVSPERVAATIRAAAPDVVALQEPDGQTARIAAAAGPPFVDLRRRRRGDRHLGHRPAVAVGAAALERAPRAPRPGCGAARRRGVRAGAIALTPDLYYSELEPGDYEVRLFADDSYHELGSAPFTVRGD